MGYTILIADDEPEIRELFRLYTDADKILGLDLGADDYLTKPINPLEAVARVNSNIRRFYALGARECGRGRTLEARNLMLWSASVS